MVREARQLYGYNRKIRSSTTDWAEKKKEVLLLPSALYRSICLSSADDNKTTNKQLIII